jgi:formylglycine-generating enzyme required for sulfatase activity
MVVVPPGTALLGAPADDPMHNPDETPRRTFRITKEFAVSRFEITRAEFEAYVHSSQTEVPGHCLTDRRALGKWEFDAATTYRDPGFSQTGKHPVACVSWDDAQAYVTWLNAQTSGGYRMLTEVEWEYVARAGSTEDTQFTWGNDASEGCSLANAFDQTALEHYALMDRSGYKLFDPLHCRDGHLNTSPVGSYRANRFGVYDMIGNVSEWVEDCYAPTHAAIAESGAPPAIASPCSQRVAKGGSWGTLAHNLRTAERFAYPSSHRDDSIGIRVAKDLSREQH